MSNDCRPHFPCRQRFRHTSSLRTPPSLPSLHLSSLAPQRCRHGCEIPQASPFQSHSVSRDVWTDASFETLPFIAFRCSDPHLPLCRQDPRRQDVVKVAR